MQRSIYYDGPWSLSQVRGKVRTHKGVMDSEKRVGSMARGPTIESVYHRE